MAELAGFAPGSANELDRSNARRTLAVASAAHALHDGYTDLIYVLLPIWQSEFALGYGMVAALRGLYAGAMAVFQIPAGRCAERWDGRLVLALGTVLAAVGYAMAGWSSGLIGLSLALGLSGAGSGTQHPIAAAAVSRAYGSAARAPLGTYNFSGDLGKAAIPALISVLLVFMPWRQSLWLMAALGLATAAAIARFLPPLARGPAQAGEPAHSAPSAGRGGFPLLVTIGVLDTGVRMGLLTFLPFILKHPHVLENYLVNNLFRGLFPFGDRLRDPTAPLQMTREFSALAIQFSLIKGLLIGVAGYYKRAFSVEHVVQTIQTATKHFEHFPEFLLQARQLLAMKNLDHAPGLTMLLRN